MGFNTWNKFGCDVGDELVRGMADAMVKSGMKDAGYQYIVIDDCWQVAREAMEILLPIRNASLQGSRRWRITFIPWG